VGKGNDEQSLFCELLDAFEPDDILLSVALYPTYFLLCELVRGGVDGVFGSVVVAGTAGLVDRPVSANSGHIGRPCWRRTVKSSDTSRRSHGRSRPGGLTFPPLIGSGRVQPLVVAGVFGRISRLDFACCT
jgi:hypothetical protein